MYGLFTLTYQRFTAVLLLIYGSLFLSGIYVCFVYVDISAFHSCVVVDLWQSVSEWHLLLSVCVLVCGRENVGA